TGRGAVGEDRQREGAGAQARDREGQEERDQTAPSTSPSPFAQPRIEIVHWRGSFLWPPSAGRLRRRLFGYRADPIAWDLGLALSKVRARVRRSITLLARSWRHGT